MMCLPSELFEPMTWGFVVLAYLDPGTGSYALQILLATLFGGMFALKQTWAELRDWVSTRFQARRGPTLLVHPGSARELQNKAIQRSRIDETSSAKVS